jgi:hypothetical protein
VVFGKVPIRCGFWDMVGMSLRKVLGHVCNIFFTFWHFPKTMASVGNSQNMEFGKRFGTCMGCLGHKWSTPKRTFCEKGLASPWDRVGPFGTRLGGGWDIACHKFGILFSTSGNTPR